ncbi:MAG: hypothetical protein Q9209_005850 [Squamulea sp. 1 TL-2023]
MHSYVSQNHAWLFKGGIESLHPSRATTPAQKASQVTKKTALGKGVLVRLIKAFLDRERSPRARRWVGQSKVPDACAVVLNHFQIGALALELLRDCRENKDIFSSDSRQLSQGLGEAIVHGNDENLKLIAGTIIREMMDNGSPASDFFPADFGATFPEMGEQASQWTTDFIEFVDELQIQGLLTQQRGPSTFAYAVFVDGITYNTEIGLSILVTVADELAVVVPSTEADTAKYIDIPPQNITNIELELGGPGSQSRRSQPSKAAALVIYLSDSAQAAYYINESEQPPCRIILAFDMVDDANLVKDRIETLTARRNVSIQPSRQNESVSSFTNKQSYPVEPLSQSAFLDLSNGSTDLNNTLSALRPFGLRASNSMSLTAAAAQVHELLTRSTDLQSHNESVIVDDLAKDPADLAARSLVMTGIESVNVSQDVNHSAASAQGMNSPGNLPNARRRSSSLWREGMNTIEDAVELQSNLAPLPAALDKEIHKAEELQTTMNDDDNDLYIATPRAPKTQSVVETNTEAQQSTTDAAIQSIEVQDGPKPALKRKISRSMRVSEGERRSTLAVVESIRDLDQGTGSGAKQSSSTTNHNKSTKRKSAENQTTIANKKVKLEAVAVKRPKQNSNAPKPEEAPSVFDVPTTPPNERESILKPQNPVKPKPKVKTKASNKKRVELAATASKRSLKALDGIAKATSKSRPSSTIHSRNAAETGRLKTANENRNPVDGEQIAANAEQEDPKEQPAGKLQRHAKLQISSKGTPAVLSHSPNVKKKNISIKPHSGGPARIQRAAAQKANQKMHDSVSAAYEFESPLSKLKSDGSGEVVNEQTVTISDKKEQFVQPPVTRGSSAIEEDAYDKLPSVIQPAASNNHKSSTSEPKDHSLLAVEAFTANPSAVLIEHKDSCQDALPQVLDVPHSRKPDISAEKAAQAAGGTRDKTQPRKGVVNGNEIASPKSAIDLRDEVQHKIIPAEDEMTLLMVGDWNIRNDVNMIRVCDSVNTNDKSGEMIAVPQSLSDDTRSPITKEDQALSTSIAKKAGSPRVISDASRKLVGGDGHGDQKEASAESSLAIVGEDSRGELSARKPIPSRHHEPIVVHKRTAAAHLASKLNNTLSGVLNHAGPMGHFADLAGSVQQPAIRPSSDRKAVKANAENAVKLLLHQVRESIVGAMKEHDAQKPLPETATLGDQQHILQVSKLMNGSSITKAESIRKIEAEPLTITNSDPYTITSGPSSDPMPVDNLHSVLAATTPQKLRTDITDRQNTPQPQANKHPPAPAVLSTQQPSSSEKARKKRSSDVEDRSLRKKAKLRSPDGLMHGSASLPTDTYKDPSRLPQVISFGTKGPRNQGSSSLKGNTLPEKQAYGNRSREPTHGQRQKQNQDIKVNIRNDSDRGSAQSQEQQRSSTGRMRDLARILSAADTTLPQHVQKQPTPTGPQQQVDNRPPLAINQPRGRVRGFFPAHSSLLGDDSAQHIASQGSRVDENGSPLPSQRNRTYKSLADGQNYLGGDDSDSENIAPPLVDDDTTLVHAETNEDYELELPAIRTPQGRRHKRAEVVRSSNSKHGPSSPTAPSAMLTDIQPHAIHSGGRLVNVRTDTVLVPATPHDPFTRQKIQRPSGFLDKLRRKSDDVGVEEGNAMTKEKVNQTISKRASITADPDTTLVEADDMRHQPRKLRKPMPVSSSSSSTNTSQEESQSSQGSDEQSAAWKRWRNALEPHQRDTLGILYEVSHQLIGHLIDTETAVSDVVDDYQRRGKRFNENLANDLEQDVGQYVQAAKERRDATVERFERFNSIVTKNLKRKPMAESLAREMEEKQQMLDAQIEEAMRLIGEGR